MEFVARAGQTSEPHALEACWIFRCAKRISTRLRSSRDFMKAFDPINRRAISRASS
jgi:hypothetical protein